MPECFQACRQSLQETHSAFLNLNPEEVLDVQQAVTLYHNWKVTSLTLGRLSVSTMTFSFTWRDTVKIVMTERSYNVI